MVPAAPLAAPAPGRLPGDAAAPPRLLRVCARRPAPGQGPARRARRRPGDATCRDHPGPRQESPPPRRKALLSGRRLRKGRGGRAGFPCRRARPFRSEATTTNNNGARTPPVRALLFAPTLAWPSTLKLHAKLSSGAVPHEPAVRTCRALPSAGSSSGVAPASRGSQMVGTRSFAFSRTFASRATALRAAHLRRRQRGLGTLADALALPLRD